jgi:hypothetical protein
LDLAHPRKYKADAVINQLGYWTDNGAYYYGDAYQHNISCCTEDKVREDAEER